MNKVFHVVCIAALAAFACFALAACGGSSSSSSSSSASSVSSSTSSSASSKASAKYTTQAEGEYATGIHHATVKVIGYDEFVITLNADSAPVTVANFCKLANDGYYNDLALYRIVEGFCLQGGSKGDSAAGSDPSITPIVGEFSENGVANPLADEFKKGTVAMARTQDPNSAASTFFITLATNEGVSESLDGKYAAFGTIDDAGMQTVDAIVTDHAVYASGNMGAINDPNKMPRIESITITD